MRKNRVLLLIAALLFAMTLSLVTMAADDIVYEFTDEESFKGWSAATLRYNFEPGYFNGYAYEKSANLSDPMLISPNLDIEASDYRYVIINMSYSLDATWSRYGRIFFNAAGESWHVDRSVAGAVFPSGNSGFVDYVFDMSSSERWKGTIKQIRIDPFECHGTLGVKRITITNTLPATEEKKEDVKNDTAQSTKKTGEFLKPNTYNNNFADVPSTEWYAKEIANAYELGLINGKSATAFDPNGNMTVAEAITLASRTRNSYGSADYDFTVSAGEEWFAPYVKFAIDKSIIKAGEYADYNALVTRGQMAKIFAAALPNAEYTPINSVTVIPDVKPDADCYSAVLKLYNAGIVMGNDGYGTFNPDNSIIRAEAAAIINRIANKGNRLSKNLLSVVPELPLEAINMTGEAKYYMDDEVFRNAHTGGYPSGWTLYPTLDKVSKSGVLPYYISDSSSEAFGRLERKIIPAVKDGVLDFEFGTYIYSDSGAVLYFADEKGNPVIQLALENNEFKTLLSNGTYLSTGAKRTSNTVHFDIKIYVDEKKYALGVDGAYFGMYDFAGDGNINAFNIASTAEGQLTIQPLYATLRHNYLATEKFVNAPDNILPYDLGIINNGGKVSKVMINTFNYNGGTLELNSNAGSKTGIVKSFHKASGNVVFETYILMPEEVDGASISLKNGDATVFSLATKGGSFVTADGTEIKKVIKNLWHIVRIEADTATDTALVKINGKSIGTYAFNTGADIIDGYEISYTPAKTAKMYVDDINAFIKLPYPEDYVPEPVIPESKDYIVGLNVCSLWRTGTHYGWDEIAAYPEIEPILGYYDEGTPEVSDWEIKMMAEHGIDYQIFCWYPDADTNKPIFRTTMNEALIDGYFNARYSDKIKFAIMWENISIDCKSWESWTDYFVPYIIEYFFLDDRYMKIDNKPFFTVWSLDSLGKAFGDKTSKEAFDYLREECINAGFSGCTIMLYSSDHTEKMANSAKSAGFDCIGAYHYGRNGANVDLHLDALEALKNDKTIDRIPAVSVGFDNVGWGHSESRNGLLDPVHYPTITKYIKDEILAKRDSGSMYSKMVLISTWNEYGEGTYVMPTARHGFKYLDGVREAFTNGGEHEDVVPTAAQKQRINYLFDQSRQWLRPQLLEDGSINSQKDPYEGAVDVHALDLGAISWTSYGSTPSTFKDGVLHITTTATDPGIFSNKQICNVSTNDANAIRIRIKVTGNATKSNVELFYKTNDGKDFSGSKVSVQPIQIGDWQDVYFDFRGKETWTGNVVSLRIDPASFVFDTAEIQSVTFVKLPEATEDTPFTVDIHGVEQKLYKEVDRTNGGVMLAVYPGDGIFARMKANALWDKNTKEFTVYTNKHTVTMVIGTDKIVIDGKEGKMYAKTYMYDGLPVIPFDTLCEALGYYVVEHNDKNGVSIMLNNPDDYKKIIAREPYKYEFDLEGDQEDWTAGNCTIEVVDGVLKGVSTGTDPAITSPKLNIEAEKYPIIKIGMKYDRKNVGNKDYVVIYFKTATTSLSESRAFRITLEPDDVSSNGEFREFEFDMSKHLQWYGKIESIRFDPFNALGTFEIDYIYFEKDMATEMAEMEKEMRESNLDDTVYNGDATSLSYNPCFSDNATVTIVQREDEANNNCYNVEANGGKQWAYIRQKVKFKPGTTYNVEFDVRTVGTNDGNRDGELTANYVVNAVYNGKDHIVHGKPVKVSDGWSHISVTVKIDADCDNSKDVIAIYANPIGNFGVNYQIDNWKMTSVG